MAEYESATGPSRRGIYWEEEKEPEDRGKAVKEVFEAIEDEQRAYRQRTLEHMRMYRNMNMLTYQSALNGPGFLSSPLALNVVRNMTNAVHSKITKHRVKTTFQTVGGDWEMREKARLLDAYGLGLTLKENLPRITPKAMLDAIVIGYGVMKTYKDRNRPCFERIFSPNLVVDFAEGAFGKPAHYYEVRLIDKRRLQRLYPDSAEAIQKMDPVSSSEDDFYLFQDSPSTTMIRVIQALYLNPDDEEDGFLSISANGVELAGSKWSDGDPYSIIRWGEGNMGWYGMGLTEELRGIQIEINRLLRKIQTAFSLLANPYILADRASAIARGQITDMPGSVILYNGKEPRVNAPQTVHPEVFAHLDRLYQRAYEISGISQLSASGEVPKQFESGRAQLVAEDVQSDRFADLHRQWDELNVDCVRKAVKIASRISGYTVRLFGQEEYEEINFKRDIALDDDEWSVYPMPTALLGETPPAQLDNAERLMKMGLITEPNELLEQVTTPDIQAYVKRVTAPKRLAEKLVGRILAGKEYIGPEPQMNLALTLEVAQSMYLEAKMKDGFPEKRLELVRRFMTRTTDLISAAAQPPTIGAGAAGPGAPPQLPQGPTPEGPPPPAAPMAA